MAGVKKPTPLEAFEANIKDAQHLVLLAEGLTNSRARRMRKELRERVGDAWKVPARDRDELDCLESQDVLLTFKPGSRLSRETFADHKPLLRQALVAACAAAETYLADKVMTRVSALSTSHDVATDRLRRLTMSVGDWLYIEQHYTRRRSGLHGRVIEPLIRRNASTSPTKVGDLLCLIGVDNWARQLDHHRGCKRGESVALLDRITNRRNKIVHAGDRLGRSRATLSIDEVKSDLAGLESVVHAIEKLVGP